MTTRSLSQPGERHTAQHAVLIDLRGDTIVATGAAEPGAETTPVVERRVYPLTEQTLLLGRDPTRCQICVAPHRTDISREHAAVERRGGIYVLVSHGQNGSFVNGERVAGGRALQNDDVIGFAGVPDLLLFIDLRQAPEQLVEALTPREREVLQQLAAGASYVAIAEALYISSNTVKSHIKSLFGKLGVAKATEAINVARRQRLI